MSAGGASKGRVRKWASEGDPLCGRLSPSLPRLGEGGNTRAAQASSQMALSCQVNLPRLLYTQVVAVVALTLSLRELSGIHSQADSKAGKAHFDGSLPTFARSLGVAPRFLFVPCALADFGLRTAGPNGYAGLGIRTALPGRLKKSRADKGSKSADLLKVRLTLRGSSYRDGQGGLYGKVDIKLR